MKYEERKIYAADLGIDLKSKKESELFKWFLACLLFGKPIQQEVVVRTFGELEKEGLTSPDAIIEAGWDNLVSVLDHGHYVRFDYSTATKLLDVMRTLKGRYGSVTNLLKESNDKYELKRKMEEFQGIGEKTFEIFWRDIEGIWPL